MILWEKSDKFVEVYFAGCWLITQYLVLSTDDNNVTFAGFLQHLGLGLLNLVYNKLTIVCAVVCGLENQKHTVIHVSNVDDKWLHNKKWKKNGKNLID